MTTTHDDKAREREQFEAWWASDAGWGSKEETWAGWEARAALSPASTGQDYVLMPRSLTAENGAKAALSGEFSEPSTHLCPSCGNEPDDRSECDVCDGDGEVIEQVPVSWTTIKRIYEKAVEVFAAPAQQVEAEKWISVETAMPNTQQRVLIAYTTSHGKRAVTLGWYCKAKTVESADCEGEVDDEYDEEKDTYYMKEQWVDESQESEYHYPIRNVTHWRPIPDLPAAGSNNGEKE